MPSRRGLYLRINFALFAFAWLLLAAPAALAQRQAPPASAARMLILPRNIVSGERATLAVLDVNGRLTPGVTVNLSDGDHLKTDATGRARFVAPLNTKVVFATIANRAGHVPTSVVAPADSAPSSITILSTPRFTSVTDRFEISGNGFCGDADANKVTIGVHAALVLAASPTSLVVLPPADLEPGQAVVKVSCAQRDAPAFKITLLSLELQADASPLTPGEHRKLTVHVSGTLAKISLQAHNLAPEITELAGGTTTRSASSGGENNDASFEVIGRKHGSFLISIRLLPSDGPPRH